MKKILPLALLLIAGHARAQFGAGNLVIYRVGSGSGSLVNTGSPVFLDEYSTTGTKIRSLTIPATDPDGAGPNHQLIASGTATSEGLLSRSVDGRYLVLTGYGVNVGGSSVSGTAGATVPRVVGLVDYQDNINTSTALTDYADGNNPRSATSVDGTAVWVTGGAGGIRYAIAGASTSLQLSTTTANIRQVSVFDNQLYISTGSGSMLRVATVGTGIPATAGQTITNLPGYTTSNSPYQFVLFDLDPNTPGPDVLYVASDDAVALSKYSLVGGSWVLNGTIGVSADSYRGLTGSVSNGTVMLYAIRKGGSGATGGGELVSLADASGYNGAFSGTPTLLATAAANTAFRGIAFSPVSGVVPNNLSLAFNAAANTAIVAPIVSGTVNDPNDPVLAQGIYVDINESGSPIPAASYTLTASSANTTVVPNGNISITKNNGQAVVKITPAAAGYSDITLSLTKDGNAKTLTINYAASVSAATSTTYWHTGISDASAAIALDDDYMVIANDETNYLYVFNRHQGGLPVKTFDFNQNNLLNLTDGSSGVWKELDLEAAARSTANSNTVYFLGSMSNSSSFKLKPNRDRIMAVSISGTGAAASFTNAGYVTLRSSLVSWGDSFGYNFTAAAANNKDSKTIDGFNLEGMVFGPDNSTLYLGFRAPLVPTNNRTNAVIAPIANFEGWFNGTAPLSIGTPIELNLGGRGIRDIIRLSNGNYVILAGSYDETSNPAIYRWTGNRGDAPVLLNSFTPAGLNPEGAMELHENGSMSNNKLQIISDDGDEVYYADGTAAKDLAQDNYRKFSSTILVSSSLTALPIQFESFNATKQNTAVALRWTTGTPASVDVFDVQRSVNGLDFTTIGTVAASSPLVSYSFTDNQPPAAAKIYYRISARELTGSASLSTIRVVSSTAIAETKLYPNPVSNGTVSLEVTTAGVKQVTVYNSRGQLQTQLSFSESVKDISTAQWPAGYYLVQVSVAGTPVKTLVLVVQ
ncbi:MAG: T9SS type A sorting domain-containing protein [Bacteroidetes bacterium]|nr:T9SS type A sorting domain-containing protein [Bacteroidota bacterium]